jgi:hypothetical protein
VAYEEITPSLLINADNSAIIKPQTQNSTSENAPKFDTQAREAALAKPKYLRTQDDWRAIWNTDTEAWDKLSNVERKKKLTAAEKDWTSRLTADERDAVVKYTGSSYVPINNYARFGTIGSGYDKSELERLNGLLKSAFSKTQLDTDIRVARGVGFGNYADKIRKMKIGDIDYDAAVRSTSYTREAAFSGLTMDISIPAGSGRGSLVVSLSNFGDGEKEFIMAPGTKIRLVDYDKGKDRAYFELVTDNP